MNIMVTDEARFGATGEVRFDMEKLVENLQAAAIISDATTIRVISRHTFKAKDFIMSDDAESDRWLSATVDACYTFSYDVEEDLLIMEVD